MDAIHFKATTTTERLNDFNCFMTPSSDSKAPTATGGKTNRKMSLWESNPCAISGRGGGSREKPCNINRL